MYFFTSPVWTKTSSVAPTKSLLINQGQKLTKSLLPVIGNSPEEFLKKSFIFSIKLSASPGIHYIRPSSKYPKGSLKATLIAVSFFVI